MRFEDYTKAQQEAIISHGNNILVSAGAGSGKTQVLTERVVYFIKNKNYQLENFLILTFTNLAAKEMKERIRKNLSLENLKDAENVDFADICTFDSFSLALVKKYHLLLNLSENLNIVDSNIIAVKKKTIINEIFNRLYKEKDNDFLSLINKYCFKKDDDIQNLIFEIYEKASKELDTEKYLENFLDNYYSDKHLDFICDSLVKHIIHQKNILLKLSNCLPNEYYDEKSRFTYQEQIQKTFESFFFAKDYDNLIANFPLSIKEIKKPKNISILDAQYILLFEDSYKSLLNLLKKIPQNKDELFIYCKNNQLEAKKLIEITLNLHELIMAYKKEYQVFEFDDIAKFALQLVQKDSDIRQELKEKYKMIMIDEYQDTSLLQDTFVSLISNNNVYMVGDIKQSIYRFRNARSDIFKAKYDEYKNHNGGRAIDLNTNFRSRREVLQDINYIFQNIMLDEIGGANYKKDHMIEYGNKTYLQAIKDEINYHADFLLYNDLKSSTNIEIEAKLTANDIIKKINNHYQVMEKGTLRDCRFSDFVILMDRGTNFETIAKIFSDYKIPLFVENDENIAKNDILFILANLLRIIKAIFNFDFNNDEFKKAFVSLARSFIFNYSDEKIYQICHNDLFLEDKIMLDLQNIIKENKHLPIADLFILIIFKLDIYHRLITIGNIKKNESYLDSIINMFLNMSKLDYNIEEFISYIENVENYDLKITLSSVATSLDSVRIMNIHKSKGLEFNIVYFLGLEKKFNRQELKNSFGLSKKFGLILKKLDSDYIDVIKYLNTLEEEKEDISEKIRLFYVMLTRTKEKMIFLYNINGLNNYNKDYYLNIFKNNLSDENKTLKLFNYFLYDLKFNAYDFDYALKEKNIKLPYKIKEKLDSEIAKLPYDKISYDETIEDRFKNETSYNLSYPIEEEDLLKCKSLKDLIFDLYKNKMFNKRFLDINLEAQENLIFNQKINFENLNLQQININVKEQEVLRASKELSIDANQENLNFGTKIHLMLEIMDLKKPDYSIIENDFYKFVIKRFLNSPIMKNIHNGTIYKEYEFFDEINNSNGIIDLMIVYNDYIDIIDYKTKNINDEAYDKQLSIYEKYISLTFHKKVNTYLYSLLNGEYRKGDLK